VATLALVGWMDPGRAYMILICFLPAPIAASLVALLEAARRPGRYRELGVFANAAWLLLFAFLFDAVLTPKS
jgi:hypothetical protein